MTATLTPYDAFEPLFDELWLATGPKERTDYAERSKVYHKALRDIHAASLRAGIERCIQASRIRSLPTPGEIRARALEHASEMQRAIAHRADRDLPAVPFTHCECRCGGRRWHRVLRDPVTREVRHFPAEIATQAALPEQRTMPRTFHVALEALAGEPMLRTHVTCKRHPGAVVDAEPRHGYVGLHEDGCPVYDPDAPAARAQAAA